MQFTYQAYVELINLLLDQGYEISNFHNWKEKKQSVILRHDIDIDIEKAVKMSRVEKEYCRTGSTYFFLLTSNFYEASCISVGAR